MQKLNKFLLLFLCCFGMIHYSTAQRLSFRDSVPSEVQTNYLAPRLGLGTMTLRDQNLSPLFYQGIAASVGIDYGWYKPKWYHDINFQLNYGALVASSPQSSLPKATTLTHLAGIHLSTTNLWKTPWIPNKRWLLEVGGAFKIDPQGRFNPSLFNNSFSGDLFMNLMASAKIQWDFTRNKSFYKVKKKGKKKLKTARQQKLSFQADVGVLNFNYMSGFTNVYMPSQNGSTVNASGEFKEYNFRMNGWRLDLILQFLQFYSTGNGHKIAFIFSAMHAPGVYKPLDFGTIQLQYSFMINQKR